MKAWNELVWVNGQSTSLSPCQSEECVRTRQIPSPPCNKRTVDLDHLWERVPSSYTLCVHVSNLKVICVEISLIACSNISHRMHCNKWSAESLSIVRTFCITCILQIKSNFKCVKSSSWCYLSISQSLLIVQYTWTCLVQKLWSCLGVPQNGSYLVKVLVILSFSSSKLLWVPENLVTFLTKIFRGRTSTSQPPSFMTAFHLNSVEFNF